MSIRNTEDMVQVGERSGFWEFVLGLIKISVAAVLIYCLLIAGLYFFQRRILFVPGHARPDRLEAGVSDMREIDLLSTDGLHLRSWYREAAENRPTIVYFQGNAGSIAGRGFKARAFIDQGYGVLLVGYRGYGGNPGAPSEAGLILDGRAALSFLEAEGTLTENIVLYGESLGSGIAVALAVQILETAQPSESLGASLGALVLEAPYTSIAKIAAARYWFVPVRYMLKDPFDSLSRIADLRCPLLILHGQRDAVIAIEHGRRLYDTAPEPKLFHLFEEGRHSDLFDHGAAEVVTSFLEARCDSSQPRPALNPVL
jgi:fermentation-respiration switch protein FrsA (DUF1100 family)